MPARRTGFTLIELMIVVAIIAILAGIAIPSLFRARIAANETSAQSAMKQFVSTEAAWRQLDADRNGKQDYWTLDVAGFYALLDASGRTLKFVDVSLAKADQIGVVTYPTLGGASAKSGYFYTVMTTDEAARPYQTDVDGDGASNTNPTRFAFCAYPMTNDTTGLRQYIVNEEGVVYQMDLGAGPPTATWPAANPTTLGWVASQ